MQVIDKIFDEERSLYNLKDAEVLNCTFAGEKDGESVLKECRNISVRNCSFSLRYPLWHVKKFELINSKMDEKTRAPLWYSEDGLISECHIDGIKCLRECKNINVEKSIINSPEFAWKCSNIFIRNSIINSEYFVFDSSNVKIHGLEMSGKYSFQYVKNLHIINSKLDTKDAFWHSENVVVENSIIKGEYLGWFSDKLTLINCQISGTQPLCYCKNLKLINCKMDGCDLAFEYSDVQADIIGGIVSVKNPKSGVIQADSVGEIISENPIFPSKGIVRTR